MLFCLAEIFIACGIPVSFIIYFAFRNSVMMVTAIAGSITWLIAMSIISLSWIFLPFEEKYFVVELFVFMFSEIIRFITLAVMMLFVKKFGEIKMLGLGLGVGSALCQVLVHNVPFLTLATTPAELYLLGTTIGNFNVVAFSGMFYSIYIITSYMSLAILLMKKTKKMIFCIFFVGLHALFMVSSLCTTYVSPWLGLTAMCIVDTITVALTLFTLKGV
ncbi:hypothetical protein EIN_086080 [Entamoeba invadens IP1]|uniref:hypothetical protein n=1 Tax=Entamoeba invadens IP1 TaxID=370355 RepID=UPI0002C3D1DF|nr:hypothetical protein EIN_086080 [Entamoeba invadens IP1]ELP85356.1 hypothetical protein EIN_086080 [Entamoeba invadens IP1]|eukprot:XP_004184702.1 hypothetical protein EIN_086080 [Entamoeba invadens IP1]